MGSLIRANVYECDPSCFMSQRLPREFWPQLVIAGSKFGTGGMMSKIKSAQMVFGNHSQMVLMNGENPRDILRVLEGAKIGTLFKQED